MSGIFDKYLNMINGSNRTMGQMHTATNAGRYIQQVNGTDYNIPIKKRMSSVGSIGSIGSISEDEESGQPLKKVTTEPNNRVNF